MRSDTLTPSRDTCGWQRQPSDLTYKQAWRDANSFSVGLYGFRFQPFFYELIRRILRERLDFRHLFAPIWLLLNVSSILRQSPVCLRNYFPNATNVVLDSLTFIDIRDV